MGFLLPSVGIATALVGVIWLMRRLSSSPPPLNAQQHDAPTVSHPLSERLVAALPQSVLLLHRDRELFRQSINTYFAGQERDVIQAAIVQPRSAHEVSTAIRILKKEYDRRQQPSTQAGDVLFAIRGGGQSPLRAAASAKGGVLIDLSHLRGVTVAEDRESVVIGAGCQWVDVTRVLDEMNLGVVGGRNADVGVAGYILGGGLSFFTPTYGLACSNVLAYQLVLASGEIVTASATSHPDLWRALKGGSNNFGVVTQFTMPCFPVNPIWSGYIYAPASQYPKALVALHENIKRIDPKTSGREVDTHAAGPIVCFTYIPPLGLRVVSVRLAYTKPPEEPKQWPVFWKKSGFSAIWRYWSTHQLQTVTSAIEGMRQGCFPGKRWSFGTTTIKNDLATIMATREVFEEAMGSLRKVKGSLWTIVMQPLLPSWTAKGDRSMIDLEKTTDDPLIIVNLSVDWDGAENDEYVYLVIRGILEQIDEVAEANGTSHAYRYLNYCQAWQQPLEGYGKTNLHFLRDVSREYDPDGFFQRGCTGGFKLFP
ncbi:FAD-binding oxidoreductase [Aspergillus homomorphus CBS 101889]|uniref:FAD-binding domain-containing protein n=1 Tax=Aspergillus homomorphus (strain CBS 101889) TaxID=1450537 RepID=A0A395IA24_ASPHC|nr:FAD-binding domain-containing protein [Aspergillus homomorphus CBS 101889]RAL15918.1 FAD-binding domain-containing protein [Aspergillus homomorphus CBS 101889]